PRHQLGEVGRHVAAVELAVDENVEPDLLLAADQLHRLLALELLQRVGGDLAARALVARLLQIGGLGEAPHRGRPQSAGHDHPPFRDAMRAASTNRETLSSALSAGRYSRLALVLSWKSRSGRAERARATARATSAGSSRRVFRASIRPSATIRSLGNRGRMSHAA